MIERRPYAALGGADHGWLKAKHHFSFARSDDPERLGHGASRRVQPPDPFPTTLFQIWIEPAGPGGTPSWGAKPFPKANRSGRLVPLASGFAGDAGALPIRAEARVLGATLKSGDGVEYALGTKRHGYLVPAKGSVEVNGVRIEARDGAAITGESVLKITAIDDAEIVLVDTA
jgi:redox-sensitive bicupin YhaK (pirin superfamily)